MGHPVLPQASVWGSAEIKINVVRNATGCMAYQADEIREGHRACRRHARLGEVAEGQRRTPLVCETGRPEASAKFRGCIL